MTTEATELFNELKEAGYKTLIGKKEYAEIVDATVPTINNKISKGVGVPNFIKDGKSPNARVLFKLKDVAEYLTAQTVRTA